MATELKTIYAFSISLNKEVDETSTREENGKTITETVKVKKLVPVFFALKNPSRSERELAEEERAAWWSHYVEKGILPTALLLKVHANYGGILSDDQKRYYHGKQADYIVLEQELERLFVNEPDNKEKQKETAGRLTALRNDILTFEQEQSVFFNNTAESKASAKMTQYLVLHLSYFRTNEDKDWEPFFKGSGTGEKLAYMDKLNDEQDETFAKAYPMLSFVAHLYSSSNGGINTEALNEYFTEVNGPQVGVS